MVEYQPPQNNGNDPWSSTGSGNSGWTQPENSGWPQPEPPRPSTPSPQPYESKPQYSPQPYDSNPQYSPQPYDSPAQPYGSSQPYAQQPMGGGYPSPSQNPYPAPSGTMPMGNPGYYPQNQTKTSGAAIAALILGILALLGAIIPYVNVFSILMGLAGIGCAIGGLVSISRGNAQGKGLAIAGLVTSILAVILSIALDVMATGLIYEAAENSNLNFENLNYEDYNYGNYNYGNSNLDAELENLFNDLDNEFDDLHS